TANVRTSSRVHAVRAGCTGHTRGRCRNGSGRISRSTASSDVTTAAGAGGGSHCKSGSTRPDVRCRTRTWSRSMPSSGLNPYPGAPAFLPEIFTDDTHRAHRARLRCLLYPLYPTHPTHATWLPYQLSVHSGGTLAARAVLVRSGASHRGNRMGRLRVWKRLPVGVLVAVGRPRLGFDAESPG